MATGSRLGQSLARCGWRRSRASGGPSLWPGVDGAGNRRVSVCRGRGGGVDLVQGMGPHGFTSCFVGGRRRRDGAGQTGLTPASDVVRFAARPRHGGPGTIRGSEPTGRSQFGHREATITNKTTATVPPPPLSLHRRRIVDALERACQILPEVKKTAPGQQVKRSSSNASTPSKP